MKKSAQVVMLPTNEKAKFGDLILTPTYPQKLLIFEHQKCTEVSQHLYFLSDEEIKEGDWVYCLREGFEPVLKQKVNPIGVNNDKMFKKIIATTDKSLFTETKSIGYTEDRARVFYGKEYLPQPSQSFIEKFVEEYNKGNVITEVLVEYEEIQVLKQTLNEGFGSYYHKAESEFVLKVNPTDNTITIRKAKDSWNREEVIELIQKYSKECTGWSWFETDEKWIEENL